MRRWSRVNNARGCWDVPDFVEGGLSVPEDSVTEPIDGEREATSRHLRISSLVRGSIEEAEVEAPSYREPK